MTTIRRVVRLSLTLAVVTAFLTNCGGVHTERFKEASPRQIGIVVGAQVFGTTGTYLPGLWGLLTLIHEDLPVQIENQINQMVLDRIRTSLETKGYRVVHLKTIHKEWSVFSNINDTEGAYTDLVSTYDLDLELGKVGAVLIVEYMLKPRLWGLFEKQRELQDVRIENFRPKYAKSKIWIYDTRSHLRLFFDSVQRGYSELSNVTIDEALNAIIDLRDIPPVVSK